jgi:trehalose 6-phosphate synthase/phosphatase
VRRLLGLETEEGQIRQGDHVAMVGAFPMGIDTDAWEARAREPEVRVRSEEIREDADGRSIVLGIDRLDFSKGLVRRFIAIEALLRSDPKLVDRTRFIQVMVPSRESVESYASLRRRLNELTGRINSTYATASAVPVHVLYRSFDEAEISALYCSADVMLVTPVRDGMNLVAKEFVASRNDEDGVLVLSEFAGAAEDLQQALLVNPYDAQSIGSNIRRALSMSRNEKRSRMQVLRQHVRETDVHKWAATFIATLERQSTSPAA